jgi:hypothetical protein
VQRIPRFPSRAVAALLARLALQSNRLAVRVVPGARGCDAMDFERLLRSGHAAQAQALYGGECMPGFDDEWIDAECQRLQEGLHQSPHEGPQNDTPAAALPEPALAVLPSDLTRLFGTEQAVEVAQPLDAIARTPAAGRGRRAGHDARHASMSQALETALAAVATQPASVPGLLCDVHELLAHLGFGAGPRGGAAAAGRVGRRHPRRHRRAGLARARALVRTIAAAAAGAGRPPTGRCAAAQTRATLGLAEQAY